MKISNNIYCNQRDKNNIHFKAKPVSRTYKDLLPTFFLNQNDIFIRDYIKAPGILTSSETRECKMLLKDAAKAGSPVLNKILEDIEGIIENSKTLAGEKDLRKVLLYSTLKTRFYYEISHVLHNMGESVPARMISEGAKILTGTDIHPGAQIGHRLFIRHGQNVGIGDTAILGDNIRVYHNVTLGSIKEKNNNGFNSKDRRHPKIGNDVIIGCNATLLGKINIGDHSKIGANTFVIHDVPPYTTVLCNTEPNLRFKKNS